MSRYFYVDNVNGSSVNGGESPGNAMIDIDNAIDAINSIGQPGDSIRILYTGTDYTYLSSQSIINKYGYGWSDGEYFTIEGYDPTNGTNRPTLLIPKGSGASWYRLYFSYTSSFWDIHDLKFMADGVNTNTGACFMLFSSSLADQSSHFRVHDCFFQGDHTSSSDMVSAMYMSGGCYSNIQIYRNFFYNVGYVIRGGSTSPSPVAIDFNHNIVYTDANQSEAPYNYFHLNNTEPVSVKHYNNTHIHCIASRYTGIAFRLGSVTLGADDQIVLANNFINNINYAFYINNTVDSDWTDSTRGSHVGYNMGNMGNSSASALYAAGADTFEIADYTSTGDVYTYLNSISDYTDWFAGYNDWTYFWEETGWMMIPDLRPIDKSSFEGIKGDPLGIKGAISHWGITEDSSADTTHFCVLRAAEFTTTTGIRVLNSNFGGPSDNESMEISDQTDSYHFGDFCSYTSSDMSYVYVSYTAGVDIEVTATATAINVFPSGSTLTPFFKIRVQVDGPSTSEGDWGLWYDETGVAEVTAPILSGTYDINVKYQDRQTLVETSYVTVDTYTV